MQLTSHADEQHLQQAQSPGMMIPGDNSAKKLMDPIAQTPAYHYQ
jgi:hypothetical protein